MKGLVDGKGSRSGKRVDPSVNERLSAIETVPNQECQDRVDVKAFTGRGKLHALRHGVATLATIESSMKRLCEASKTLNGVGAYLVLHHRKETGYTFLRWRERMGRKRHLSWDDVADLWLTLPVDRAAWCKEASVQALALNAQHLAAREAVKNARLHVKQLSTHLFPRLLPVGLEHEAADLASRSTPRR